MTFVVSWSLMHLCMYALSGDSRTNISQSRHEEHSTVELVCLISSKCCRCHTFAVRCSFPIVVNAICAVPVGHCTCCLTHNHTWNFNEEYQLQRCCSNYALLHNQYKYVLKVIVSCVLLPYVLCLHAKSCEVNCRFAHAIATNESEKVFGPHGEKKIESRECQRFSFYCATTTTYRAGKI